MSQYFSFDSGTADVSTLYCFASSITLSSCIRYNAMHLSRATSVGSSCDFSLSFVALYDQRPQNVRITACTVFAVNVIQ